MPTELRDALWQRFKDALEPLRQAGKLGMVHFQFAPWLLRNRDGHAHVAHCVETMQDYTVSVEFRNQTWFDDAHLGQTLAFERELNVVHTVVDGPQGFHNSVPPVWESTHIDFALVRLHGRNHETWNIKGATVASERFDYDYPDAELDAIAARVERLAPETFTTHVVMNNNNEDQGQRNAATLMRILERRRAAQVPHLVARAAGATAAATRRRGGVDADGRSRRSEWATAPGCDRARRRRRRPGSRAASFRSTARLRSCRRDALGIDAAGTAALRRRLDAVLPAFDDAAVDLDFWTRVVLGRS